MSRREKARSQEATLNLTPTIDVVLLLLIFFVVTIRLPRPEADIQTYLPRKKTAVAGAGPAAKDLEEIDDVNKIRIMIRSRTGQAPELYLNGGILRGGFRQLDGVLGSLRRAAEAMPEVAAQVVLDAGPTVPYRAVVTALDLCAKHGYGSVSFTLPGQEAPP